MRRLALLLLLVLSLGCSKQKPTPAPEILVSIAPYAYFAERIVGHTLRVETLIPERVNPHLYEPAPKQVTRASQALVWFRLGDPQEKRILKTLRERNPSLSDLNLCRGIPLLSYDHENPGECCGAGKNCEGKDLHVWLSPKLARYQAKKMAALLVELFPQYKAFYLKNVALLVKELDALDEELRAQLAPYKNQAILVSHPAFAYYCRSYRLRQLSVECAGKDPRPRDIARTLQLAKKYYVRSVLIQAQYSNKGAELIAKDLNLPVYLVDPYAKNYFDNMRQISGLIAR